MEFAISSALKTKLTLLLGITLGAVIAIPSVITDSYAEWTSSQGMSIDIKLDVEPLSDISESGEEKSYSTSSEEDLEMSSHERESKSLLTDTEGDLPSKESSTYEPAEPEFHEPETPDLTLGEPNTSANSPSLTS